MSPACFSIGLGKYRLLGIPVWCFMFVFIGAECASGWTSTEQDASVAEEVWRVRASRKPPRSKRPPQICHLTAAGGVAGSSKEDFKESAWTCCAAARRCSSAQRGRAELQEGGSVPASRQERLFCPCRNVHDIAKLRGGDVRYLWVQFGAKRKVDVERVLPIEVSRQAASSPKQAAT
eukprot:scaffold42372_cov17-Tisochrysis_lutea.AAC.3